MPKGNNNEQEPLKRNKRNIEDQIQDMKRNEKFTIDLDFLEQLNSTDILENQISQLKREIEMLKGTNKQPATSSSAIPKTKDNLPYTKASGPSYTKASEPSYAQVYDTNYNIIPTINVSESLEKDKEEPSLSSIEETLQTRLEKTLDKNIRKQESVQSNATYVIKKHDIDDIDMGVTSYQKDQSTSEDKYNIEDNSSAEEKSSSGKSPSTTSSDFEEFL